MLERIPFLWKRIGFSGKVTCRNIFRYKKRLLMTVIGIAGCTALVFTGFGLKDAIRNMVPLQFEQIQKYDLAVTMADDASPSDRAAVQNVLRDSESVKAVLPAYRKDYEFTGSRRTVSAGLIVPLEADGAFESFVTLRERVGGKPLSLTGDGVILSEKLAKLTGAAVGDTVQVGASGGRTAQVRVAGITENYLLHYAYMTRELFVSLFGEEPPVNTLFSQMNTTDQAAEDTLGEALLSQSGVSLASFNTNLRSNFNKMIGAMDMVTLVLIVSAAALAFVVLFSLTSINIDERKRELATLKVLGFYDGETAMYLYRESIVLTVLGIGAGLVLGAWMLQFVLTTAEVDLVMFSRHVGIFDYVVSALLTVVFAVGVNLLMSRIIRRIDMVESLKSVE